jgi:hypothetical protein
MTTGTPLTEEKVALYNLMYYILLFKKEVFFMRIQGCPESGIYIAVKKDRLERSRWALGRFSSNSI